MMTLCSEDYIVEPDSLRCEENRIQMFSSKRKCFLNLERILVRQSSLQNSEISEISLPCPLQTTYKIAEIW